MNTLIQTVSRALGVLLAMAALGLQAAADPPSVQMLKVYPVGEQTCVSTSIPMPEGQALSGLSWYANDAQVSFPMVVLLEGIAGKAPDLTDAALILAEVTGESLDWGSLTLQTPVISSTGRIDVVFLYPQNTEIQALGAGGGPGIGVIEEANAQAPFLSHDGYAWARFEPGYRLAVDPILASGKVAQEATVLASLKDSVDRSRFTERPEPEIVTVLPTALLLPYPNPFNPRTVIRYQLSQAGPAKLSVYDVRGRLVTTLLDGVQPAGAQELVWMGTDGRGKSVASGTYFVVLTAASQTHRQKLTLLR